MINVAAISVVPVLTEVCVSCCVMWCGVSVYVLLFVQGQMVSVTVINRDLESASSKSMNLSPPKTVNFVLCVCLDMLFVFRSALCVCCCVFPVCLFIWCVCVCLCSRVVCVHALCVCGVFTRCVYVVVCVCSGKANDERNRDRVVLDLLSNLKWASSTMKDDRALAVNTVKTGALHTISFYVFLSINIRLHFTCGATRN